MDPYLSNNHAYFWSVSMMHWESVVLSTEPQQHEHITYNVHGTCCRVYQDWHGYALLNTNSIEIIFVIRSDRGIQEFQMGGGGGGGGAEVFYLCTVHMSQAQSPLQLGPWKL